MNRRTARAMHSTANMAYWIENPDWHTVNPFADTALTAIRALPFKAHEALKSRFYKADGLIAVNGESVVVANGEDKVDKFMFRYPGKMALEAFHNHTKTEVSAVTHYLAGVALPTTVGIKPARIFRNPAAQVNAVAQTQTKVNLDTNVELVPGMLHSLPRGAVTERAAHDIDILVTGTHRLSSEQGLYPDIAKSGGNVRINLVDGEVTLIDVMPFYENGSRLIGDRPPNVIEHLQDNLAQYERFAGQYGG